MSHYYDHNDNDFDDEDGYDGNKDYEDDQDSDSINQPGIWWGHDDCDDENIFDD